MKRLAVFLLALSLSGAFTTATISAAGKALKVGVIADTSGSAGGYGTSQKNAYDLAADDLKAKRLDAGGNDLTFDVQDSASDPAQVISLVQKFTTDGSALIIGPTLSSEAFKADPIAVKAAVPVLATSNTAIGITAMGPCVFRNALSEDQVVPQTIARAAARWHPKTAAIIYGDDDQFTKTDYEIFKAGLARAGITVVETQTYHKGDVDFKAQLTQIASKKPDLLVVGSLVEEAAKIVGQAKTAGISAHMIGGNGLNSPKFISLAGPAAEGVVVGAAYFSGNTYPGNREFVDRYQKRFGSPPDQFAAQAYAAAQIIAAAAKTGKTTAAELCSALGALPPVQTVLGSFAFESDRNAKAPSAILTVKDGKFVAFG
ncbi:MAG: ABC transporter substrate-binding protein [Candidatus Velthaea sp.]|jgi:branched-chain amino acid transport system substrate-binding protein